MLFPAFSPEQISMQNSSSFDRFAPRICGIGTATPAYTLTQETVRSFAQDVFAQDFADISRLLPIFTHAGIHTRHFAEPRAWYAEPHDFVTANSAAVQHASALALQAARHALAESNLTPADIGSIVFVSSTGIATPSLDAQLAQDLGCSATVHRVPVWGLGCAGGVSGLGLASMIAHSMADKAVLLVAVELCSMTFQHQDRRKSNLVALSLFADGAAAVLVRMSTDNTLPIIRGRCSMLFTDTHDIMGWDITNTGLQVRFSRDIPSFIAQNMPPVIASARQTFALHESELLHYVMHPGGTKVLEAYRTALQIPQDDLEHAREIMRTHGNMSSPTVLFVLKRFLSAPRIHSHGLMLALGPGFSAECVLLECF
jgi:alkylresorcinol/alkylpyrone synthase